MKIDKKALEAAAIACAAIEVGVRTEDWDDYLVSLEGWEKVAFALSVIHVEYSRRIIEAYEEARLEQDPIDPPSKP